MRARLLTFGSIEIDGRRYDHDIVIERGAVRKRGKKPSKPYRDAYWSHAAVCRRGDAMGRAAAAESSARGVRLAADHARGGAGSP